MTIHPVLIAGKWRAAQSSRSFSSENPALGEKLPDEYPISLWADCDAALAAATAAAAELHVSPPDRIAAFLEAFADRIEARKAELVDVAHAETGPAQGAAAGRGRAAANDEPTAPGRGGRARGLVGAADDRHQAEHPLDVRAHRPGVRLRAEQLSLRLQQRRRAAISPPPSPPATRSSPRPTARIPARRGCWPRKPTPRPARRACPRDGAAHLSHQPRRRRAARLRSRAPAPPATPAAARRASSSRPPPTRPASRSTWSCRASTRCVILPGALAERGPAHGRDEFVDKLPDGDRPVLHESGPRAACWPASATEQFIAGVPSTLQRRAGRHAALRRRRQVARRKRRHAADGRGQTSSPAGAPAAKGYRFANTLLRVSGEQFLAAPETLQTEAFGNASLVVVADDVDEAGRVVEHLEGNLTGCIYSHTGGADDAALRPSSAPRCARKSAGC